MTKPRKDDIVWYTLSKYGAPGRARTPVLFKGPPGSGKTFESRLFAREAGFDSFIELGGHRGLESFDLQGQTLLEPNGGTIWKDGPLTEAFRFVGCHSEGGIKDALERGRTACLLIDEIYRIPAREREMLLTALQPETIHGVPCYKIRTGRPLQSMDGAYHDEMLYAPVTLLSIVATTNVGIGFDVEEDCAAGAERWVARFVRFDEKKFLKVLKSHLRKRDFSSGLAKQFLTLYKGLENAHKDNQLGGSLTLRTAVRIVENAFDEEDFGPTIKEVGEVWVEANATGEPLPEQLVALTTIITEAGFALN